MGNKQPAKVREEVLISEHPSFQRAKVVTYGDRTSIEAKFKLQTEQYDQWKKQSQRGTKGICEDYLLLPEKSEYNKEGGLCGNVGTLTNLYPLYPYQISSMIKQRQQDGLMFKESELWYLLYTLASAKNAVPNHKIGDIKPQNVFANQEGKLKVVNAYSWPNQHSAYVKALEHGDGLFSGILAPQDMAILSRGILENDKNQQSEVFSIGATVLSAGILGNVSDAYDIKNRQFSEQAFFNKKAAWASSKKYSDIFKSIILNLVRFNPQERATADELHNFMFPYRGSILNKEQFTLQSVPTKIQATYHALRQGQI